MKETYIFDLDGTLADISHRRHLVEGKSKKWDEFYRQCVHDTPNIPVVEVAKCLRNAGAKIVIMSGRSNIVEDETKEWLNRFDIGYDLLFMRTEGDYFPDDLLKNNMLRCFLYNHKAIIKAVFDDRDKVVKMWRNLGLTCFQVAEGDF